MKKSILAAAAILLAGPSVAASAQEAQQAEQAPQEEKKICRTERMTGSLTRRTRICMTEREWRELNARTHRGVSEMQGQASGGQQVANNPGPGGPGS